MSMKRGKKLALNTLTALINQIIMTICAFILPRMILQTYGSEVNGLVSSIQQFLAVISFMELGVGAVVQAALYKPLSVEDNDKISKILSSANKYFTKLAFGMIFYVGILLILYPKISNSSFSGVYTGTLILSMCISYFAQYFFGLKNQLLVIADQKGYIHYALNSIVLIANNVVGALLILNGFDIQFVKLSTSLLLLIRPIFLALYVKRKYKINKKVSYDSEPIPQKWNGVAQHVATVVLNSTDSIVLTIFSTLSNVSIYNVYYIVINGLNSLIISLTSGIQSLFGNMISKKEQLLLNRTFEKFEVIFHICVTFIYGCVMVLIVPFVMVYTKGVSDINYSVPVFAVLICLANMMYCYRLPYNTLIKSAGHFKQTQNSAWIEMIINIVVSIVTVSTFGIIGVAIGTLVAMTYRTVYLVFYLRDNIINRKVSYFIQHMIINALCIIIIYVINFKTSISELTFLNWILLAIKSSFINLLICICLNVIAYRKIIFDFRKGVNKK